jgi:hypothetical protein
MLRVCIELTQICWSVMDLAAASNSVGAVIQLRLGSSCKYSGSS